MKLFGIILFISAGIFLGACKKDPPPNTPVGSLPPLTHEGKNTFGCLIDGEPFVAGVDYSIGGPTSLNGFYNEETFDFGLNGTREEPSNSFEVVYIYAIVNNQVGNYLIDVTHDEQIGFDAISSATCDYYHDQENPGKLNITFLDTQENIVAGTFHFDLKNANCPNESVMKISEGRFDFRY